MWTVAHSRCIFWDIQCLNGDTSLSRFVPMARSASLGGYAELARHVGLNPDAMLRQVGLNPRHLADPDMPISTVSRARIAGSKCRCIQD